MACITSGEMADCDWLRSTFSGQLFPVMDQQPLRMGFSGKEGIQ